MSTVLSTPELRAAIVEECGGNPDRYRGDRYRDRACTMTSTELDLVLEEIGLGFLVGDTKQQKMDTLMIRLGRDERTGVKQFDTSDLRAIAEEVGADV